MADKIEPRLPMEGVPIRDLAGLFAMQLHCGFCGFVFGAAWFCGAYFVKNIFAEGGGPLVAAVAVTGMLFIAAAWIGGTMAAWNLDQFEALEGRARFLLHVCSGLCVAGISILIWMTGGAASAFTVFYVMTFTLTLGKNMTEDWEWPLLALFLAPAVLVCFLAKWTNPVIDSNDWTVIQTSMFHYVSYFVGFVLSMVVPTVSARLVARRSQQRPEQS